MIGYDTIFLVIPFVHAIRENINGLGSYHTRLKAECLYHTRLKAECDTNPNH